MGQAGLSPITERTDFRDKYSLEEKNYGETILFSEKVDLLSCWVTLPMHDTGLSREPGPQVQGVLEYTAYSSCSQADSSQ